MNRIQSVQNEDRLLEGDGVNFCYIDESGTGQEPIATMVGIIVDSGRMHLTKNDWAALLAILSEITDRHIVELHTSDFYRGNGVWRNLDGLQRVSVIESVCDWLIQRKHHIVYSSVWKAPFYAALNRGIVPREVNSVWQFLGFHITLAVQKYSQPEKVPKGNTILVFDNEECEKKQFIEIVKNPPSWSDEYYTRSKNQSPLDQIVDVPHFADSRDVPLLQVADFLAFFLRRYAEINENLAGPNYPDEETRLNGWIKKCSKRVIPRANMYLKSGRKAAHELFFAYAPPSLRVL